KSEFVSNVSHELRTPLTTIKTLTQVLQTNKITDDEREEYLQTIGVECDRQIDFIQNLLDISRIEAGAFKVKIESIYVAKLVAKVAQLHRKAAELRGLGLSLVSIDDAIPAIETDARVLDRILSSLVDNAMKYTPNGGRIDIAVSRIDRKLIVSVTDTGCGV